MDPYQMSLLGSQKFIPTAMPMYYCPWQVTFPPQLVMPTPATTPTSPPQKKYKRTWSREQIEELYAESKAYCTQAGKDLTHLELSDFTEIAKAVCRSPRKCMNKLMEIQVSGTLRSGVWGPEEDQLLKQMLIDGKKKWGVIATAVNNTFHKGLKVRTGKQCKERWNNHINPLIERGEWTPEDDLKLLESHKKWGNRWSFIAKELSNRTDSSIKNRIKSLLNRERQNVLGGAQADLLESLIARKRAEVSSQSDLEPASPASRKPVESAAKGTFSSVVASLQGFDFEQLTKME